MPKTPLAELVPEHLYLFLCPLMPLHKQRDFNPLSATSLSISWHLFVLDLIPMECAAVCPVGDAQVYTHEGIALSPLLIFPLVLLTVSQPGPKVTLESG